MRTFPGCMNLLAVSLTASLPGYEIESASLCGEEHLGISLESGRISVPRMIVAQFDIIRHEYIKELAPKVLQTLQAFVLSCYKDVWFTVFSAVFLLLHQVACTSRDYPLTGSEDVRHGGVTPLAHWQYFKRCDFTKSSNLASSALMSLEQDQTKFLKRTVSCLEKKLHSIPANLSDGCWEHELFGVSKMFFPDHGFENCDTDRSLSVPPEEPV
jgi:hypothetical protein